MISVYPQPLNYLIPPVSVILTVISDQPDAAEFRERVLDAAAGLASNGSTQRSKRSKSITPATHTPYTLASTPLSNEPTSSYKIYPRHPGQVPPPQPKQQVVAENEIQQLILETLNDGRGFYGEVNLTTVQFLREKAIPGWQMHIVTFAEMDGEQRTINFVLRQQNDGTWKHRSSSSSGNFREMAAQHFAHIHDHPLIAISGGKRTGVAENGTLQHEFFANGEVIDKGFDVVRVRLSNENGDAFEDTVQDGLVLFSGIQEQEVQFPLQAELYNRAGKVVWRETVFDNRPPSW